MIRNLAAFWASVLFGYRTPVICLICGWHSRGERSLDKHMAVCR